MENLLLLVKREWAAATIQGKGPGRETLRQDLKMLLAREKNVAHWMMDVPRGYRHSEQDDRSAKRHVRRPPL